MRAILSTCQTLFYQPEVSRPQALHLADDQTEYMFRNMAIRPNSNHVMVFSGTTKKDANHLSWVPLVFGYTRVTVTHDHTLWFPGEAALQRLIQVQLMECDPWNQWFHLVQGSS